jgi:hypothetical protein
MRSNVSHTDDLIEPASTLLSTPIELAALRPAVPFLDRARDKLGPSPMRALWGWLKSYERQAVLTRF